MADNEPTGLDRVPPEWRPALAALVDIASPLLAELQEIRASIDTAGAALVETAAGRSTAIAWPDLTRRGGRMLSPGIRTDPGLTQAALADSPPLALASDESVLSDAADLSTLAANDLVALVAVNLSRLVELAGEPAYAAADALARRAQDLVRELARRDATQLEPIAGSDPDPPDPEPAGDDATA